MFSKRPPGRPRSQAAMFLMNLVAGADDECQFFPFDQKHVAWGGGTRTPHWITCRLVNGEPSEGQVPVRQCGVYGCINGRHYKWGTMGEAQANRIFRSRKGGNNPRANISDLELSQLRSINWGNGRFMAQVAERHGVTVRTLNSLLRGWVRAEVKPYVRDEF